MERKGSWRFGSFSALVNKKFTLFDISNGPFDQVVGFLAIVASVLLFSTVVGKRAIVGHALMDVACSYFVHARVIQNLFKRVSKLTALTFWAA